MAPRPARQSGPAADPILPSSSATYSLNTERRAKLLLHKAHRRVILGHNDQTGGALVQPVDDARALLPSNPFQLRAVVQDSVGEGAGWVAGRRVHDEPASLVDDQQIVVFVYDV